MEHEKKYIVTEYFINELIADLKCERPLAALDLLERFLDDPIHEANQLDDVSVN